MKKKGFTLIEVIIVLLLISIITLLITPALLNTGTASKEALKISKINAIKVAAMNYVENDVNKYSDCNSLSKQTDIKSNCKITLEKLINEDYLDKDKDVNTIMDPTTNEEMTGSAYACYDMNTSKFTIEYYEEEPNEICTNTGVHTLALQDNSIAISYHENLDFYTNIIKLGEYKSISLNKNTDKGVNFEIVNNKLHITYTGKSDIINEIITASVTVKGVFESGNGEETRSVIFNAYIYDKIDEHANQLSITISPNDKLKELGNLKENITLTCVQNNEYGCEINLGYFGAYFNKTTIENYVYLSEYSLGEKVTYQGQNYTKIEAGTTYRIYNTESAPTQKSIKDKSVLYINIVPGSNILTFDAHGGEVNPSTKDVTYGSPYGTLPTPTKVGYTFKGWYDSTSYTNEVKADTIVDKTTNHTVHAKWEASTYTVTVNANDGTIPSTTGWTGSGASASKSVTYDQQYGTLPTPTRTGYEFKGWWTNVTGGSQVTNTTKVTITSNQSLYAHWEANKYTIRFNGNNASNGTMENMNNLSYDQEYTLTSNAYTKVGYTFTNWNTLENGTGTSYANGAKVTNLTTGTGIVTLYAQWSGISYSVLFDGNNASTGAMSNQTGFVYGTSKALRANTYTKVGYTFAGWKKNNQGNVIADKAEVSTLTNISGETVRLVAQWAGNSYTVAFDGNGGSGSMQNQTGFIYGTDKTLTANTFTKTGYTFAGWKLNNSGDLITNQAAVSRLTSTNGATVTLYAQWEAKTYTVTVNANDGTIPSTTGWTGSGTSASKSVTYDQQYGTLPTQTRTGYEFKGWWTNATGGNQVTNTTKVTITSNQSLYAHWEATYYCDEGELTYDTNKGYICTIPGEHYDAFDHPCVVDIPDLSDCGVDVTQVTPELINDLTNMNAVCLEIIKNMSICHEPEGYACPENYYKLSGNGESLVCYKAATLS